MFDLSIFDGHLCEIWTLAETRQINVEMKLCEPWDAGGSSEFEILHDTGANTLTLAARDLYRWNFGLDEGMVHYYGWWGMPIKLYTASGTIWGLPLGVQMRVGHPNIGRLTEWFLEIGMVKFYDARESVVRLSGTQMRRYLHFGMPAGNHVLHVANDLGLLAQRMAQPPTTHVLDGIFVS